MDYRYNTDEKSRDFHKQRKAFIILNGFLEFLPDNSLMSHYEYCTSKGINKDTFNEITRGFYLNGDLVFYKDNFIYDDKLINESLNYLDEISKTLNIKEFNIYFGEIPENDFAYDLYYGIYKNGNIVR